MTDPTPQTPAPASAATELQAHYQAQQEARRREVQALSPELRRDLERLCVVASGPDTHGGITESRGREILACSVTEFRALILEHDPPEPAPAPAGLEAAVMGADWEVLGRAVHRSWRDGMLQQGRTVERERMAWETLPARDRVLDQYIAGEVVASLLTQSTPPAVAGAEAGVLYAERADYRDGDVTLVGAVRDEGVRLGMQAVEPWYGTGVLIPPGHPAYRPALTLIAALAQAQAEGGK